MNQITIRALAVTLVSSFLLSGCSGPWNDPNPPASKDESTYFGSFTSRPKHLDPVRSYSAEEGLFLDQIYEPPLQYHFLKRPYELIPSTAESMPDITLLDEKLVPLDSDSDTASFSLITVKLKPGIQYQPHPAFALNAQGTPLYLFNASEESKLYTLLSDFPETDTRVLNR